MYPWISSVSFSYLLSSVVEPGEVTISSSELSLANGNSAIESLDVVSEDQKATKTQAKNLAQEFNLFTSTNFNNVKIIEVKTTRVVYCRTLLIKFEPHEYERQPDTVWGFLYHTILERIKN